ncbi:ATP-binding protein [Wolbachia endosymbiont of Tetranychus urticae]|uniref:ATP-binding protein n=1 Tax=Wolbachia endosymbiont of Tetranychus urticae TaxID=169184 RepID=UPI00397E628B
MSGARFFKFVLLCLTIAAFIYLMYVLFFKIKAAAATISFMPIIITSAVVTCSVICTAAVLGFVIYLMKPSKVIEVEQSKQEVTFNDVIVSDEVKEELRMICDIISQETKIMFEKVGFKPPQGYLLHGPPGNGKTLLARAVAGEAKLPFFFTSGAIIAGQFVNQGAHDIQELFHTARKKAPCVIFIDEIDSIGSERIDSRSQSNRAINEDHNKTLNQLLIEMDGFNVSKGVIVVAATNRREVLDEALLRPGRFSKHIYIPLPELGSREKILDLYMKNVPVGSDLNLKEIAEKTEGYSGAELSNLVNEAKHNTVRRTQERKMEEPVVSMGNFTKALEEFNSTHKKFKNRKASNTGNNVISALLQPAVENYMQQHLTTT